MRPFRLSVCIARAFATCVSKEGNSFRHIVIVSVMGRRFPALNVMLVFAGLSSTFAGGYVDEASATGINLDPPFTLSQGDTLILDFNVPFTPGISTWSPIEPDFVSFGFNCVVGTSCTDSIYSVSLFDGSTLLGVSEIPIGPSSTSFKSPTSIWSLSRASTVDFATILDGSIDGRFELERVLPGSADFGRLSVSLSFSETPTTGSSTNIQPVITGARVVPEPINLSAMLDGGQEVPAVDTEAFGFGLFELDDSTGDLFYQIILTPSLLSAPETEAHIHGPAPPGIEAPVLFPLPLGTPKTDTIVGLTSEQQTELLNGLWYVNVHTTNFPGGEIRGHIVPEPSTLTLAGFGLLGLIAYGWRRRRRA